VTFLAFLNKTNDKYKFTKNYYLFGRKNIENNGKLFLLLL